MTIQVYFRDVDLELSPLPRLTLSFQKLVKFHASFPNSNPDKTEFNVDRVAQALVLFGGMSKVFSYVFTPSILIPLQAASILFQAINPFFMSAWVTIKLALSILTLGATIKWAQEGTLQKLSNELFTFYLESQDYLRQIESNRKDLHAKTYKKVEFTSPPKLPSLTLLDPINRAIGSLFYLAVKLKNTTTKWLD